MAKIFKDPKGALYTLTPDGRRIDLPDSAEQHMTPVGVLNEQGVGAFERFIAKNLTSNPTAMRAYLEHVGYDTRPYGEGFNFAVRLRGSNDPWRLVDPDGADPQDLFDLVADGVRVAATAAGGTAGGILGGAAGGIGAVPGAAVGAGGSAALAEQAIQAVGSAAGVPNNFNPGNIATIGLLSAASEPAAASANAVLRPVGRAIARGLRSTVHLADSLVPEAAVKIAGFKSSAAISGKEALLERTVGPYAGKRQLTTFQHQAASFISKLRRVAQSSPEKQIANQAVTEEAKRGLTVNIKPMLDDLESMTLKDVEVAGPTGVKSFADFRSKAEAIKSIGDADRAEAAADLIDTIRKGLYGVNPSAVPVDHAEAIKQGIQSLAREAGLYRKLGATALRPRLRSTTVLRSAAGQMREFIESVMEQAGRSDYVDAMASVSRKLTRLEKYEKMLGVPIDLPASKWTDEMRSQALKNADSYIRGVFGTHGYAETSAIENLEKEFGINLMRGFREAQIGEQIGMRGVGEHLPKLTAGGSFRGLLIGGSVGGGLGLPGGVGPAAVGGAAGALAGLSVSSPSTLVRMTPAIAAKRAALGRAFRAVPPYLEGSTRVAAITTLQQQARAIGGKSAAREDQRKKKPTVLTGF